MINELISVEGKSSIDLHDVNASLLNYIENISQLMCALDNAEVTDTFYRKLTSSGAYLTEELAKISQILTEQINELERERKLHHESS